MSNTIKLRQDFVNFFRANEHKYLVPSKVYNNDPTLLFVNAGMNQLKDVFLGKKDPKDGYTKLCNSQICIRAGGKHNDISACGKDSYHLTLFEMLGNWSLSAYKKEVAIDLAFRYLTENCKLNSEQIYVTYFEGTNEIPADLETKTIWAKYLPDNKIIPGNFEDNFWMMADTGPCGVCTEIHYDLLGGRSVPELVNKDDPQVIEIWNNVFIQYNKDKDGYHKLDKFYVDTGMGLERLSMILHNKQTIYQTDAFKYLFGYAQALTNADIFMDKYDGNKIDIAYRIFADHIRTTVISLFDGVVFGSNKKEYVLRKIFRRLLTYLYLYLNNGKVEQKFNHPLVKCMISDILNYFLKKKHDADAIWNQLIKEELLYIGRLKHIDRKINNLIKSKGTEELALKHLHEKEGFSIEILQNHNKLILK